VSSVRDSRKAATRQRVLGAARSLFVEVGYEAATIRTIADRAGVATGTVFTSFANKHAVLHAVNEERLEQLYAEFDRVLPHLRGSVADKLCSIMAVHYDFEMKHPKLFTAVLAANFEWCEDGEPLITFGRQSRLRQILQDVLKQGAADGEISTKADLELFIETLIAAYGFNYRHAAQRGLAAKDLIAIMDRQIVQLIEGVRA
jgi:AcrR family transcriptional regulator